MSGSASHHATRARRACCCAASAAPPQKEVLGAREKPPQPGVSHGFSRSTPKYSHLDIDRFGKRAPAPQTHLLRSVSQWPAQRERTRPPSTVLHGDGSGDAHDVPCQPGAQMQTACQSAPATRRGMQWPCEEQAAAQPPSSATAGMRPAVLAGWARASSSGAASESLSSAAAGWWWTMTVGGRPLYSKHRRRTPKRPRSVSQRRIAPTLLFTACSWPLSHAYRPFPVTYSQPRLAGRLCDAHPRGPRAARTL
eukprot:5059561-Prymnesium_polylepis.1